jgi:HSP20 family protein
MTNTIAKKQNGNHYGDGFDGMVNNIFRNSLRRFFDESFWEPGQPGNGNVPVNVRETEEQFELDVIAPGCRKEDFRIGIEGNLLTISMEHKEEKNEEDKKTGWVRNEYLQRSFSRTFTLDETVDLEKIGATYQDGILRLTLGKNEKAKQLTRSITVN